MTLNVLDVLKRIPSTTNVRSSAPGLRHAHLGQADRGPVALTAADLVRAINEQNAQYAAGIGQPPVAGGRKWP